MCCSFCHTAVEKWRENIISVLLSKYLLHFLVVVSLARWFVIGVCRRGQFGFQFGTDDNYFMCFIFQHFSASGLIVSSLLKTFSWPAVLFELFLIFGWGWSNYLMVNCSLAH